MTISQAVKQTWWVLLPATFTLALIELMRPLFPDNIAVKLLLIVISSLVFSATQVLGHRKLTGTPVRQGYVGTVFSVLGVTFVLGVLAFALSFPASLISPAFPVFGFFVQAVLVVALGAVIACMASRPWLDGMMQAMELAKANQRPVILCVTAALVSLTAINATTITYLPYLLTIVFSLLSVFLLAFMKVFSIVLFIKLDMEDSQENAPDTETNATQDSTETIR